MAEKKIILVVEDEASVLDVLETVLVQAGYEVIRAVDGEEAVFRAKGHPKMPDLILADIMMPKMDGFEMRSALRADRATRGIPVIFLTAKTNDRDKAMGLGLGALRYIVKPFAKEQVLEAVRTAFADVEEWPDEDEELSRLTAHLGEVKRVLGAGGAVGKRLDFLMQELNREANTLGSKSVDIEVTKVSLELKLLIEQMREQIQNIE